MYRRFSLVMLMLVLSLVVCVPVFADQPDNTGGGLGNKAPDFSGGVYADGALWGTKGTTTLPAPTADNQQSYDPIFVFTDNSQLAVGEAAPGNPSYNGGRWTVQRVTWTNTAPDEPPVLKSYEDVMAYIEQGYLTVEEAGVYFQCPLLSMK